nr:uncharacterized protein LOC109191246 [Ipomoea batatas]
MSTTSSVSSSTFQNRADDPNASLHLQLSPTPHGLIKIPSTPQASADNATRQETIRRRDDAAAQQQRSICLSSPSPTQQISTILSPTAASRCRSRASTVVVKLSLPKKMSSSCEDVGVEVASMVLATLSMLDKPENIFLITLTGAPCFPISVIASPNSPTVEASFCKIPATLSTLDDGTFNAEKKIKEENKSGSFGKGTVIPRISKPADVAATTSKQNDQAPVGDEPALNVPSSSVDKVAGILQKLASTVGEFGEAMTEIGKQGAPVNVMRKTFSGLSNMLNVASTMEATSTPTSSQLDDIFFGNIVSALDILGLFDPFIPSTPFSSFVGLFSMFGICYDLSGFSVSLDGSFLLAGFRGPVYSTVLECTSDV